MNNVIDVRVVTIGRALVVIALFLALAHTCTQVIRFTTGHDHLMGITPLFDLNSEANVPAFYSAVLLLSAAVLLTIISLLKGKDAAPFALHWKGLAAIFYFLAFDEATSIHELLDAPTVLLFDAPRRGIFHFAWVIPGIALVIVLAILYLRFWLHLPPPIRGLVFAAGAIYVGGALGMELVGGRHYELHGFDRTFIAMYTVEEVMEISGMSLFVFSLAKYLATQYQSIEFRFPGSTAGRPPSSSGGAGHPDADDGAGLVGPSPAGSKS